MSKPEEKQSWAGFTRPQRVAATGAGVGLIIWTLILAFRALGEPTWRYFAGIAATGAAGCCLLTAGSCLTPEELAEQTATRIEEARTWLG